MRNTTVTYVIIQQIFVEYICFRYEQVLNDLHACYFAQRETLLAPSITTTINDLASKHTRDHCALVIFLYLQNIGIHKYKSFD